MTEAVRGCGFRYAGRAAGCLLSCRGWGGGICQALHGLALQFGASASLGSHHPMHTNASAPPTRCLPAPLPTVCSCRVFAGAVAEGGIVKGIRVPHGQKISNSRVKPKGDVSSEPRRGVAD